MKSRINKLDYKFEIDTHKDLWYYKDEEYHRDKDLPAILWEDGYRVWYKNGLRHRDNDKPSTIFPDGRMQWWENGNYIKDNFDEIKNK